MHLSYWCELSYGQEQLIADFLCNQSFSYFRLFYLLFYLVLIISCLKYVKCCQHQQSVFLGFSMLQFSLHLSLL